MKLCSYNVRVPHFRHPLIAIFVNLQIDFSGFEIAPCDFTGIRLLLSQVFLKTHVDVSEMSSFLIDQLDVGSVIKVSRIR